MSYDTFKNISLQQLESLLVLIEAGSFTKAAVTLFLSQSTLTKQIQNLEESAGTRLVDRSRTGVSLTPEGQIIYDYARRVTRLRDDAKERLERLKNQESGHIYVSASSAPATYILPKLLTVLHRTHPDIRVHTQMHDSEETLQIILSGQAEVGLIGKETFNKKIISEQLCKDELVLAVPLDHPFASQKIVTISELAEMAFVMRERGSGTREIVEASLQRQFGKSLNQFNIVCEVGSSEAVKEAILAGLGVSILSIFAVRRELELGLLTTVKIADCALARYFYLIYRKNFSLRKHHRHFVAIARDYRPS